MADRVPACPGDTPADFWLGLLHPKLGRCLWQQAVCRTNCPPRPTLPGQTLAHTAKHWRFEAVTPCGWKQAQTTGGGLALAELEPESFAFRGCPGLYFVGETLDCAGTCGRLQPPLGFRQRSCGRAARRPRRCKTQTPAQTLTPGQRSAAIKQQKTAGASSTRCFLPSAAHFLPALLPGRTHRRKALPRSCRSK